MNDAATLNGRPTTSLTIDGERYDIHPLTIADFGDLQAWLDRQLPNPLDVIRPHLQNYNAAQQQAILRAAVEVASSRRALIGTDEASAFLSSIEGVREMLYLAIRKGRPEVTRAEVAGLASKLSVGDIAAVFRGTGLDAVADGEGDDPKGRSTSGGFSTT